MIGNGYYSTGITVEYRYAGGDDYGWAASLDYLDGGFCNDVPGTSVISTEGTLCTRYAVRDRDAGSSLAAVIDVLKADAECMGITWREPAIYYRSDGEDPDHHPMPEGGWDMLRDQAQRLGWSTCRRYVKQGGETAHA
jgi:hypothetical protein